jgi:hypothetical protein
MAKKEKPPATLEEFEALLLSDDPERFVKATSYNHCIVVDWKEDPEEVFELFAGQLPEDSLEAEFEGDDDEILNLTFHSGSGSRSVQLNRDECEEEGLPISVAKAICSILPPEFEARIFTWTSRNDTLVFFVAPSAWWQAMEAKSADIGKEFQVV